MEESYLRSGQVARLCGKNRRTISRWAKQAKLHPTDISSIGAHYQFPRQEIAGMNLVPESWLPSMPPTGTYVSISTKLGDIVNALFDLLKEQGQGNFYIDDKLKSEVYQELKEQVVLMVLPQDIAMKHWRLREGTEKLQKAVSAISPKVEQLLKEEIDNVM